MIELLEIQNKLNAPKNLFNKFGNYNYRSAESILESVKPLLKENKCILLLSDEIVNLGNRYYIKATATLKNEGGQEIIVTGFAREEETKKGMDGSQITGASSSYARKYALNGLFAIDDEKDSDSTNTHNTETKKTQESPSVSIDGNCPACGKDCRNIKEGTTKTGKPYKMGTCECGEKFFINNK